MRPLLLLSFSCAFTIQAAEIHPFAGTGTKGYSGDGGPALEARLNGPSDVARGPDGALYVCDTGNHAIRRIGNDGKISTVAGTGKKGFSGDGGPATQAQLNEPYELAWDSAGNLYWVERLNHAVRRLDQKTGNISTVAGNGKSGFSGDGGPAVNAQLSQPHSLVFDTQDNLYVCDIGNHRIRKIDLHTGMISTFAGTGEKQTTPDGAPISGTPLKGPRAIDIDPEGNLWLALRDGNQVYELDVKSGLLHHIAGTGLTGFSGNGGPAKDAALSGPKGISVGPDGNIYLADTESHTIRMIDRKTGNMEWIAGNHLKGDGQETDPLKCALNRPHGIYVDRDGTIYIGDTESHRVRVIRR